jgi:hypothetical protein
MYSQIVMSSIQDMIIHCLVSIVNAYENKSKLSMDILNMDGYSGHKTRHLYNNICNCAGANYLEVGTWKGSSLCSALYNNSTLNSAIAIDNWSEFNGPKDLFLENTRKFLPENSFRFIEKDCWKVSKEDISEPIHIFMYDGEHNYEAQKKAITHFHQFFAKYVIVMIDDWVCDFWQVRQATLDGIQEMKMKIHFMKEIGLYNTSNLHTAGNTFWNGVGIFILERTDI